MTMTAREIYDIIMADNKHEVFGLRADHAGIEVGTVLPNSHQWWQDYQEDSWGELPDPDDYNSNPEHPYNEELGCWDDGELDGVSTIGVKINLRNVDDDLAGIEKALKLAGEYLYKDYTTLYLVAGGYSWGGNDIGEVIIEDGTVIGIVGGEDAYTPTEIDYNQKTASLLLVHGRDLKPRASGICLILRDDANSDIYQIAEDVYAEQITAAWDVLKGGITVAAGGKVELDQNAHILAEISSDEDLDDIDASLED